eukprot:jgi/Mesvir1/19409/Mv10439-RA.1
MASVGNAGKGKEPPAAYEHTFFGVIGFVGKYVNPNHPTARAYHVYIMNECGEDALAIFSVDHVSVSNKVDVSESDYEKGKFVLAQTNVLRKGQYCVSEDHAMVIREKEELKVTKPPVDADRFPKQILWKYTGFTQVPDKMKGFGSQGRTYVDYVGVIQTVYRQNFPGATQRRIVLADAEGNVIPVHLFDGAVKILENVRPGELHIVSGKRMRAQSMSGLLSLAIGDSTLIVLDSDDAVAEHSAAQEGS